MTYSTEDYKGFEIEIIYDDFPSNPLEDWDHLGTFAFTGSNYRQYGKKADGYNDRIDMLYGIADLSYTEEEWYEWACAYKNGFDPEEYLLSKIAEHSFYYDDHDLFMYVSKDDVRKEWSVKSRISSKVKGHVMSNLKETIEVAKAWADGEVFGYKIEDIEPYDSCWGFYGTDFEDNGLMEYAKNAIDCHIADEEKKELEAKHRHFNYVKRLIKSKVALIYRTKYQLAL